jgi:hypothetical protein
MRLFQRRTSPQYLFIVLLLGCLFAIAAYPLKVTVDGYTYLSSARSIFTNLGPTHYYWLREPGYPVFLRAIEVLIGSSDIAVTLGQSFLLAGSLTLSAYVAFRDRDKTVPSWLLLVLPVVFFIPQFFGYSSIILKQPLIGIVIAVGAWFVMTSLAVQRARSLVTLLIVGLGVAALSPLIAFNLSYFWLWPAFIASSVLATRKVILLKNSEGLRFGKGSWCLVAVLFVLTYTASSFALSITSENLWETYKAERSGESTLLTEMNYQSGSLVRERLTDPLGAVRAILETTPELLMLTPNDNAGGVMENDYFTWIQVQSMWRCGAYDTYTNEPYTTLGSYVQPTCRSERAVELVRELHPAGKKLFQLSSIALLTSPVIFILRRRWRSLLFVSVPLWFVFNYGFHGGFVVDRYGHPVAMLSYVTLLMILQIIFSDIRRLATWARFKFASSVL